MLGNKLSCILNTKPYAFSVIKGSDAYPEIEGVVRFYQVCDGVIVSCEVKGLPVTNDKCCSCNYNVFGFHIHNGEWCSGNQDDPFADALNHYNPLNCQHPLHAGDLPPLFGNSGYALSTFYTERFSVDEVVGKTIIIHSMPDDFTTLPSGNSGVKIGCGIISYCS